jgi:VanZ family protein
MLWLRNFWLFVIWFAIILYLSFTPLTDWPKVGEFEKLYFDKLVHVAMYGILCFLLLRGLFKQNGNSKASISSIIGSVIFCSAVGIAIEFLQPILTMYRQFEIADMIADTIGAIAVSFCFHGC